MFYLWVFYVLCFICVFYDSLDISAFYYLHPSTFLFFNIFAQNVYTINPISMLRLNSVK